MAVNDQTHREENGDVFQMFLMFIRHQAFSGILLIFSTIMALLWVNSQWGQSYFDVWNTKFTVGFSEFVFSKSLLLWINDGLMAMFFFVVGLEIKREVIAGELSSFKQVSLPVFAAIGGMVLPAVIYVFFNYGEPTAAGWGIPTATDIAFSLGVLALLGTRVPLPLKIFLTALAIIDDIGAVLIIAIFYSSDISLISLAIAAAFLAIMAAINYLGVRRTFIYAILGIGGVWTAFFLSGVHPTIAGILAAFTIPASRKINVSKFKTNIQSLFSIFEQQRQHPPRLHTASQQEMIDSMRSVCDDYEAPLQRIEHSLHPWVIYFIMPVFALSNAGIILSSNLPEIVSHPVSAGIIFGLVLGKVLGITLFSWIGCKMGVASLPKGITFTHITGVAFLAGIGFTMSLFIAGLAFSDPEYVGASKIGILLGSLLSGIAGYVILRIFLTGNKTSEKK